MKDLILIAASGLAREVLAMSQSAFRVVGVVDDDPSIHGTDLGGVEIFGGIDRVSHLSAALVVCVGSGRGRRSIVERLAARDVGPDRYATLVDDSVRLPARSAVGHGTVILAGSVLTTDIVIGHHVVIMPNCTLTHDDIVDDFVTLAAGVAIGGVARIGEAAYLGMNSSIRQRVSVGAGATVGMGAAVLRDVPAGETWAGVPARALGVRL